MKPLQRLLLVPSLTPLVALALVASLNGRQSSSLRFLTWRSPVLPLGAWIAIAAAGGALVSGAGALLLSTQQRPLQRHVRREPFSREPWAPWPEPNRRGSGDVDAEHRSREPNPSNDSPQVWPERDVRDPAPTVAVPYRVIKRGEQRGPTAAPVAATTAAKAAATTASSMGTGHDDWSSQVNDDW